MDYGVYRYNEVCLVKPCHTFTQYVWNIAQMMLFTNTCPEKMTAPPNFVPFAQC